MISVVVRVEEDEEDVITTCAKCRQLVTNPTTLPCLDSLCAKCFTEVHDAHRNDLADLADEAACPRCREKFDLTATHVQTLPGFIDRLVAVKKLSNQNQADDNCDICKQLSASSEHVAVAEYYCIECRQRMCASCATRHPLCSSTKNHNLVGLRLDSAKKVLDVLRFAAPACTNHKDKFAAVHCYQCSVRLCSQCQNLHSSQYSNHELEVLTDDTYSQLTHNVKSLRDQLHQQLDACVSERSRVQKLLSDRRNGLELAEKSINDKADEIVSLIQKERDDLLSALHLRNDQSIGSLDAVSVELSSGVSGSKKALTFAKELLEKGSVEDMLLNYRILNDRVTRHRRMSVDSSVPDDSINNDVSPASLIRDVCTSLDSQSKFCFLSVVDS